MLLARLWDAADAHPEREAVVAGGERLTYAALCRRIAGLAARLGDADVRPGQVVPIVLDNGADFVIAFFGALAAGARPLPLPPSWTRAEREAVLACAGGRDVALVGNAAAATGLGAETTLMAPFLDERSGMPPGPWAEAELLVATSGSTGVPKIVRLGTEGTLWNAQAHADSVGLVAGDRVLVVSPLYHSAPLVAQLVASLVRGATLVVPGGLFSPKGFLKAVRGEGVTVAALAPTHVQLLVERLARDGAAAREALAGLRLVTIGSAPMREEALAAFWALLSDEGRCAGAEICLTYGLTEAGPRLTTLRAAGPSTPAGSVGQPLDGVALRVTEPGAPQRPLAPGERGELWVRTPGRMFGYVGEAPAAEAWLATGDLASLDAAGALTLHGRLKDLILTGGVNVSPQEIENALCRDERVADAAVVGAPHAIYGEIVKAYVVPRAAIAEADLIAQLASELAPYKLPRQWAFVDALPRTATGKVDKRKLTESSEPIS